MQRGTDPLKEFLEGHSALSETPVHSGLVNRYGAESNGAVVD